MMMKEMLKRFQVAISLAEDTAHPNLSSPRKGGIGKWSVSQFLAIIFYSLELLYWMEESSADHTLCGEISTPYFGGKLFHLREKLLGS